jgi:hypothetical protein
VKKPVVVWTIVAVVVLTAVLVIAFVPGRERVSLTLSHYRRWPHGATLKLSNNTRRTITYVTYQSGFASLSQQKTPDGWTNTSIPMSSVYDFPQRTTLPIEPKTYAFVYPASPVTKDYRVELARSRELKSGQSAEVYVELEPDGLPVRAGVVCRVPQGSVAQQIGKWVGWLKQWCHLKSRPPGEIEVWCSEPLQVSAKPERVERE